MTARERGTAGACSDMVNLHEIGRPPEGTHLVKYMIGRPGTQQFLLGAALRVAVRAPDGPCAELAPRAVGARLPTRASELRELVAVLDHLTRHSDCSSWRRPLGRGSRTREPPGRLRENRSERFVPRV